MGSESNVITIESLRERRARRARASEEDLLTKTQLAEALGLKSTKTIERYVAKGMPVALYLWGGSGAPRFYLSDCLEWHRAQG